MNPRNRNEVVPQKHDFYPTPLWAIEIILPHLFIHGRSIDPACGDGRVCFALLDHGSTQVEACDIRQEAVIQVKEQKEDLIKVWQCDALEWSGFEGEEYDLIITNPPNNLSERFATRFKRFRSKHCGQLALFLPLDFVCAAKRTSFLMSERPDIYILNKRPDFNAELGIGDNAPMGNWIWAVWRNGIEGGRYTILDAPKGKP